MSGDYLKQKVEGANSDISILLDNVQLLGDRLDLIERLREVQLKMNWLVSHFESEEKE